MNIINTNVTRFMDKHLPINKIIPFVDFVVLDQVYNEVQSEILEQVWTPVHKSLVRDFNNKWRL